MSYWFGGPHTLVLALGAKPTGARGVSDAVATLAVSVAGTAAISLKGSRKTVDQRRSGEGLGQEANCPGLQHSGADALFREGRDENERHTGTLGAHEHQQLHAAHNRHLHIRNHARRVIQVGRSQELLGRRKCMDRVSMRPQKIVSRGTHRCIIVNDGNNRKCRQGGPS